MLYGAGELFACRSCYGLAYESQQQDPPDRAQLKAQKIRMRLGGSGCPADLFPDKPKGMCRNPRFRGGLQQASSLRGR